MKVENRKLEDVGMDTFQSKIIKRGKSAWFLIPSYSLIVIVLALSTVSALSAAVYFREEPDSLIGGTPVGILNPWWYWSNWFGYYSTEFAPWIYHLDHGFLYRYPESTNESTFFYDDGMGAWWWTSESTYPYIFVFDPPADNAGADITAAWLWYFEGSKSPRSFGIVTGGSAGSFLFFDP